MFDEVFCFLLVILIISFRISCRRSTAAIDSGDCLGKNMRVLLTRRRRSRKNL
ncbi:hypothetical protein HanRHA438_Chr13g0582631 [Helianthus annuus]|nr:hypothetical protein HanRHA438_Chr13g0582631 [Helianthus annuus]